MINLRLDAVVTLEDLFKMQPKGNGEHARDIAEQKHIEVEYKGSMYFIGFNIFDEDVEILEHCLNMYESVLDIRVVIKYIQLMEGEPKIFNQNDSIFIESIELSNENTVDCFYIDEILTDSKSSFLAIREKRDLNKVKFIRFESIRIIKVDEFNYEKFNTFLKGR